MRDRGDLDLNLRSEPQLREYRAIYDRIVRDSENGLLVPPRDSASLAAGVLRLAGDRELLERLRGPARADAQALAWRRIAERNLEVYAETGAR